MMLLVRVGVVGHVGRFRAADQVEHPRGTRVIVRTARGLETGLVLGRASDQAASDGDLLRKMAVEDELLESRLQRFRDDALLACDRKISELKLDAVLLDAELLFDGVSLYFYFLGEPTPTLESVTIELAKTYDATAQVRQFAEALEIGCGPDCGTDAATGCGSGGCSTCAVATACKTSATPERATSVDEPS